MGNTRLTSILLLSDRDLQVNVKCHEKSPGEKKETSLLLSLLYGFCSGFVHALAAKTMLVAQSVRCEQTDRKMRQNIKSASACTLTHSILSPLGMFSSYFSAKSLYSDRHQRPLVATDNTVRHSNAHIK